MMICINAGIKLRKRYGLIVKHSTWDVVEHTDDTKVITCKCVVKEKPDKLKARLTARGFSQQQGFQIQ